MRSADTTPEVQRRMDEHYRRMTPAERLAAVRAAWRTARAMALAGLRLDHPDEDEVALEARWAERRLGPSLYALAVATKRAQSS